MAEEEERFVFKYVGPGDGPKRFFMVPWREFVFNPYEELSRREYDMSKMYLDRFSEFYVQVPYEEYLGYLAERERPRYCGDFGGTNSKGEFCGRRVDHDGLRCEHHHTEEEQGTYEFSGWERPSRLHYG